jgi:hypothetical protein
MSLKFISFFRANPIFDQGLSFKLRVPLIYCVYMPVIAVSGPYLEIVHMSHDYLLFFTSSPALKGQKNVFSLCLQILIDVLNYLLLVLYVYLLPLLTFFTGAYINSAPPCTLNFNFFIRLNPAMYLVMTWY